MDQFFLRVRLVRWILGRMEKKKMKEKRGGKEISLSVWLDGFVEGKLVGPRCFLPEPTKMFSPRAHQNVFSPNWGENWSDYAGNASAHEFYFSTPLNNVQLTQHANTHTLLCLFLSLSTTMVLPPYPARPDFFILFFFFVYHQHEVHLNCYIQITYNIIY